MAAGIFHFQKENKDFAETAFNQENLVRELGIAYVSIPLGDKASYRPQAVDTLAQELADHIGKALIYCLSGGPALHVWMAYIVRHRDCLLDDAAVIGKRIKYPTTLEDLLGAPISFTIVK